jgi:glutaredoxin
LQGHTYHDVKKDPGRLDEMLQLSNGQRKVPVIVEGEKVTVGYGGT